MNLVNRCVIHIYEIIYVINAAQCCILQKYSFQEYHIEIFVKNTWSRIFECVHHLIR